jgi:hypothetical protein
MMVLGVPTLCTNSLAIRCSNHYTGTLDGPNYTLQMLVRGSAVINEVAATTRYHYCLIRFNYGVTVTDAKVNSKGSK